MHNKLYGKRNHEKTIDFACQICDFTTLRADKLRGHIKSTHLEIYDFKCDYCEYKTAHGGHLNRHKSNVHKNKNQKQFKLTKEKGAQDLSHRKCPLCEFEAETDDSLTGHLMSCHVVSE